MVAPYNLLSTSRALGSRQDAQEIAVPLALISHHQTGQPVNIHLFSGALHLPWYSLSPALRLLQTDNASCSTLVIPTCTIGVFNIAVI